MNFIKRKTAVQAVTLCAFLLFAILLAVSIGSANLSILESLKIILRISDATGVYNTIIWKVRLPRVLLSGLTGMGLAIAGAAFQGLFQNPLADPHILGVSSGAALGASIAMILGVSSIPFIGAGSVGIFAFIGALGATALVYSVARAGVRVSTVQIVLAGSAVSAMLSAIISMLMIFNRSKIEKVYFWTLGSFSGANWNEVWFLFFFIIVCGLALIIMSRDLDALATGDETAASLGVDTTHARLIIILITSLLVAACVSVSGIIGFVGLIIPHVLRMLIGSTHRKLLPFSALGGAIFMTLCDTFARNLASPAEIPVGAVTAIFGGPFFIYLLYRNKGGKI